VTAKRPAIVVAERLYSIEEAAELWSVSRDTIERLLGRGELRHTTIANRRRIPASALEEFARAQGDPHRTRAPEGTK
jgi:excisionase family DNA binding protein